MSMYRSFGAPGASRGTNGDTVEAAMHGLGAIAEKLGLPSRDPPAALAAAREFRDAYAGFKELAPKSDLALARLDGAPGRALDLDGALNGPAHGAFDIAGQMGHAGLGLFKAVIDILHHLFSDQAFNDTVFGALSPQALYNQTVQAAYESTKFLTT